MPTNIGAASTMASRLAPSHVRRQRPRRWIHRRAKRRQMTASAAAAPIEIDSASTWAEASWAKNSRYRCWRCPWAPLAFNQG